MKSSFVETLIQKCSNFIFCINLLIIIIVIKILYVCTFSKFASITMLGIITILAVLAITIWYFFVRPLNFWTNLGVKQTKPWIFFGDSWATIFRKQGFNDFVEKIYKMHPGSRYSGMYTFNKPVFILRDPELIKQITVKDFEHFTDHRPFVDPDADPLLSNSLFSLRGARWKEMRNTLSPTFTSSKIKSMYMLMVDITQDFVKHFLEKDDEIIEFDVKDAFSRFTNDIIATTAFGVQVNSLVDQSNIFFTMGKQLTSFRGIISVLKFFGHNICPKLLKYLDIPFLDKKASKYFYEVMYDTIRAREERNILRPDMIQLMLEARKDNVVESGELSNTGKSKRTVKITDAEMASHSMIFFFAGFDTVSTAMTFGSYELATNRDIQDRLRNEINETQKDGTVTYDDLMQMKYMDMVVTEVLRKWPPFPNVDRVCTKPYIVEPINKDEKPVPLEVNQQVWIPVYGIQRDPKYFPNPEKFDPERFSDKNKDNIVPYTYNTFGIGPRICIGNRFALVEIKALFFNLLLHYEIVPTKKTPIPLVLTKDFSQIPENGLWLGLKRIRT